jgi:acetylornithine/N-succinyldiaminopimelate aminotransferase
MREFLPAMATTPELYDRYVLNTAKRSLTIARGEGSRVWDDKGNSYLDFATGIAVSCLGHGHPALAETYAAQSRKLIHCSNLYYNENAGPVAERLVRLIGPGKIFFSNSGAEANEGLIKLARLHGRQNRQGAYEVIAATQSFHGRTMATLSATGQEKIRSGFEPLLPGMIHVPYNDLAAVRAAIGPKTSAILVEGIQGESGIFPATPDYLRGLRELSQEHNLLLLMDEVQGGFFRSGRFQSYQRILEGHEGGDQFRPDALSLAKSLGGGFPIGAFWVSDRFAPLFTVGSHNTTYGGSPLGTAVIGAILDVIERDGLEENVRRRGAELIGGLGVLQKRYPGAVAVRGHGAIVGLELAVEPVVALPHFQEAGLLLAPAGSRTLRYLPPYTATSAEIDEALARTEKALQAIQHATPKA